MKFGQLTEYNHKNILFKNHTKNEAGRLVPDLFSFSRKTLYQVKASGLQRSFNVFRQPLTYNKNFTTNPEICSILTICKSVWEKFLHQILCMIFQEHFFSCCILLTVQISLANCHYFLRYWAIGVLLLFANQAVTS